jgi:pimeloyl-ACP methyl ester carboxylesterase
MARAEANGIELEYETFGDPSDPTLLLVMGLGAQLIAWPDDFCRQLAGRGFFVIRYDNRDVGLSTKFDSHAVANAASTFQGGGDPAYTLDDMADDGAALLDALGRDTAHVVGASMGGMIAQLIALRHGARVLSLTSIMSHAGGVDAVPPTEEALAVLITPRPTDRAEVIENSVKARRVIGGKGWPMDEEKVRADAARAFDRMYYPDGFLRQMAAIMASPSRVERLGSLSMPVLVLHGLDDTLVPPDNGRKTHEAIPGSTLVEVEGMGHDIPEPAWPDIVDAIVANTEKASAHA